MKVLHNPLCYVKNMTIDYTHSKQYRTDSTEVIHTPSATKQEIMFRLKAAHTSKHENLKAAHTSSKHKTNYFTAKTSLKVKQPVL